MTIVDTGSSESVAAAAEQALKDAVRSANPVFAADDDSVVAGIRQREETIRQLHAQQAQLIAEAQRRKLPSQLGARTTSAWLQHLLRISPGEAKTRVIVAESVQERTALSGEPLPPHLPEVVEALSQGEIGLEHARVIADGIQALPASVDHEDRLQAETTLVEHAEILAPDKVRMLANRIRYHYDQDGSLRDKEYQHERRELHLAHARDGMTVLKARLDGETGAKLHSVLEPLAAPQPAIDGERDPRPAGARNADAFDAFSISPWPVTRCPTAVGNALTSPSPSTMRPCEATSTVECSAAARWKTPANLYRLRRRAAWLVTRR